ncbi:unnamed protein product [Knipowitschia caucasica]
MNKWLESRNAPNTKIKNRIIIIGKSRVTTEPLRPPGGEVVRRGSTQTVQNNFQQCLIQNIFTQTKMWKPAADTVPLQSTRSRSLVLIKAVGEIWSRGLVTKRRCVSKLLSRRLSVNLTHVYFVLAQIHSVHDSSHTFVI